ncbi:MAG: hypothetical protein R3B52_00585 [Candidatus Paceibacterota bacterium]
MENQGFERNEAQERINAILGGVMDLAKEAGIKFAKREGHAEMEIFGENGHEVYVWVGFDKEGDDIFNGLLWESRPEDEYEDADIDFINLKIDRNLHARERKYTENQGSLFGEAGELIKQIAEKDKPKTPEEYVKLIEEMKRKQEKEATLETLSLFLETLQRKLRVNMFDKS